MAQGLLERAGLSDDLERLLSVEDAPAWKPDPDSYAYALSVCGVTAGEAMLVAGTPGASTVPPGPAFGPVG